MSTFTLNGHPLNDEHVLVLGFAFGAAERRLAEGAVEDPTLVELMRQTLAELRALARGHSPEGGVWPPKQEPKS